VSAGRAAASRCSATRRRDTTAPCSRRTKRASEDQAPRRQQAARGRAGAEPPEAQLAAEAPPGGPRLSVGDAALAGSPFTRRGTPAPRRGSRARAARAPPRR
jgi:hypothetical protein